MAQIAVVKVFTELHRVSPSRTSGTGQYIGMTEALRVHLEFDKRFNAFECINILSLH